MNILVIVISILMLLSIMTYARLQGFLTAVAVRSEAVCIMQVFSREDANEEVLNRYENTVAKSSDDEDKIRGKNIDADKKINFSLWSQKEVRAENGADLEFMTPILKKLIENIYKDRPFYQKIIEKRPEFLDQLINALSEAMLAKEQAKLSLKKPEDIANLQLDDPELQDALTHMFRRPVDIRSAEEACKRMRKKAGDDYEIVKGPVFTDYVSFGGNKVKPFRIYLAGRPLLLAIYRDPATVEGIIAMRRSLLNQLNPITGDPLEAAKEAASNQFEQAFRSKLPADIPPAKADFHVTKTAPPRD